MEDIKEGVVADEETLKDAAGDTGEEPLFQKIADLIAQREPASQALLNQMIHSPLTELGGDKQIWTGDEIATLQRRWFGEWWPERQPLEPIVRWGLIQAAKKVWETEERRPIQVLWTRVGKKFEVSVLWSKKQVTLLIQSPPIPQPSNAFRPRTEPSALTDLLDYSDPEHPRLLDLPLDDDVIVVKRIPGDVPDPLSPNVEILQGDANGVIVAERLKTESWD